MIVCPLPGFPFRDSWHEPRPGGRLHLGTDIVAPTGTPIHAAHAGRAVRADGPLGGIAYNILGTSERSYYCHLSRAIAPDGGDVEAGEVIGLVGETGNAASPHLHFGYADTATGPPVNPYPFLIDACEGDDGMATLTPEANAGLEALAEVIDGATKYKGEATAPETGAGLTGAARVGYRLHRAAFLIIQSLKAQGGTTIADEDV